MKKLLLAIGAICALVVSLAHSQVVFVGPITPPHCAAWYAVNILEDAGAGCNATSVTWPASGDIVVSNGTGSPAGLAPTNGACAVGAGGSWTAGECQSVQSSITTSHTTPTHVQANPNVEVTIFNVTTDGSGSPQTVIVDWPSADPNWSGSVHVAKAWTGKHVVVQVLNQVNAGDIVYLQPDTRQSTPLQTLGEQNNQMAVTIFQNNRLVLDFAGATADFMWTSAQWSPVNTTFYGLDDSLICFNPITGDGEGAALAISNDDRCYTGPGQQTEIYGADGHGTNMAGGGVQLVPGIASGSAANGYLILGAAGGNGAELPTSDPGVTDAVWKAPFGGLALSGQTISADSILGNASASAVSPTVISLAALGGTNSCAGANNALTYNTATHAWGCNTISGGSGGIGNATFGTATGNVANDIVTMSNTTTGIKDSGTALSSLAPLANPTFTGSVTATGLITLADLATQATNTILGNATSGTASPTALAIGSCSGATNALIWTTNSGFGCNTISPPAGANPTASLGLSAINGSASTFMRSDGAPALSQAIAPTWTGLHTFDAGLAFGAQTVAFGTTGAGVQGAWTHTDSTTGAGTVANNYESHFGAVTDVTPTNAITITNEYGAYFEAPIAGTHLTFTNSYAAGFGGAVLATGTIGTTATGSAAATAVSVRSAGYGMFSDTSGDLEFAEGGSQIADYGKTTASTWHFANSVIAQGGFIANQSSTCSQVSYEVSGQANTGFLSFSGGFPIGACSNGTEVWDYGQTTASTFTVPVAAKFSNASVNMPSLGSSSAATTGTVCWTTATGLLNVDTTTTCLLSLEELKDQHGSIDGGQALSETMKLKPFWFSWKKTTPEWAGDKQIQPGLGAHQVAGIDKRLAAYDPKGKLHGVRYQELTAFLVADIQEQQKEITALDARVSKLEAANDNLRRALAR